MNTPRSLVDAILTIPADQLRRQLNERYLGIPRRLTRPEGSYTTTSAIPPVTQKPEPPSVDMTRLLNRREDRREFHGIQAMARYSLKVVHPKPVYAAFEPSFVEVIAECSSASVSYAWERTRRDMMSLDRTAEDRKETVANLIEVGLLIADAFEQKCG